MKIAISPVSLFRVADQTVTAAQLLEGIAEQQLSDWESAWQPVLAHAITKLWANRVAAELFPQSAHWNWRAKVRDVNVLLAKQGFSIVCDGMTQGMMIVDTISHHCQLPSQRYKSLVYVEYLENAPWNRSELLFSPPRYRGIGSILMRTAIEFSLEQGFKGRIGLHALPQADRFYRDTCGMTDCGEDRHYDDLRYFEMTTEQAVRFIND